MNTGTLRAREASEPADDAGGCRQGLREDRRPKAARAPGLGTLARPAAANVFSALDDINFELRRGESLGMVGENGAGKSTLLKMIAGVVKADPRSVVANGRVGALLELGSDFHPEYTGAARTSTSPAALLGLAPTEIEAKRERSSLSPTSATTYTSRSSTTRPAWSCVWASPWRRRWPGRARSPTRSSRSVTSRSRGSVSRWMEDYLERGGTLLLWLAQHVPHPDGCAECAVARRTVASECTTAPMSWRANISPGTSKRRRSRRPEHRHRDRDRGLLGAQRGR